LFKASIATRLPATCADDHRDTLTSAALPPALVGYAGRGFSFPLMVRRYASNVSTNGQAFNSPASSPRDGVPAPMVYKLA
jgi:hypothetical protein